MLRRLFYLFIILDLLSGVKCYANSSDSFFLKNYDNRSGLKYGNIPGPVAQGDGPLWVPGKNPEESQFSIYGSAHVGIFGSIVQKTDIRGILRLNLLATDFYHDKAYLTYLYYNPYEEERIVSVNTESGQPVDLYNTVSGRFIARDVNASAQVKLSPRQSAVIVCVPAGGKIGYDKNKMLVDGVVVDYRVAKK